MEDLAKSSSRAEQTLRKKLSEVSSNSCSFKYGRGVSWWDDVIVRDLVNQEKEECRGTILNRGLGKHDKREVKATAAVLAGRRRVRAPDAEVSELESIRSRAAAES